MYRDSRGGGLYLLDGHWYVSYHLYLSKPNSVYLLELTGSELTRIPRDRWDFEKKPTSTEVTYSVTKAQM